MGICKLFFWKVAIFLLFFILLPFILLFIGPGILFYLFIVRNKENINSYYSIGLKILIYLGIFLLGILVDPLIWIVLAIIFIPGIIFMCYTHFSHGKEVRKRVEERLKEISL